MKKWKRVHRVSSLCHKLSAIPNEFCTSFRLFYVAFLSPSPFPIKTWPKGYWNNLKNTPRNYFYSVVSPARVRIALQSCFSSYSLGNLRSPRKQRIAEKGLQNFTMLGKWKREHKKRGIMLSIKAICPSCPLWRKRKNFSALESFPFLFLFLAIKFSRFYPELIENEIKIVFITRKKLRFSTFISQKVDSTKRES